MQTIANDWSTVQAQLGVTASLTTNREGRLRMADALTAGPLGQVEVRQRAFAWLSERVNTSVNVLRPRVRSAVADYQAQPG